MRNHNNFNNNLSFANAGEKEVAKLLSKYNFKIISYNNDYRYDILCETTQGKETTIEVKEDVRAEDTGNVVIEYESRGKPSGIQTSCADFWVFRVHQKDDIFHYMYKTENVKKLIREKKYFSDRQMQHTDSKNKLYFFKVKIIRENSDVTLK